jgi:hypothetical protein
MQREFFEWWISARRDLSLAKDAKAAFEWLRDYRSRLSEEDPRLAEVDQIVEDLRIGNPLAIEVVKPHCYPVRSSDQFTWPLLDSQVSRERGDGSRRVQLGVRDRAGLYRWTRFWARTEVEASDAHHFQLNDLTEALFEVLWGDLLLSDHCFTTVPGLGSQCAWMLALEYDSHPVVTPNFPCIAQGFLDLQGRRNERKVI